MALLNRLQMLHQAFDVVQRVDQHVDVRQHVDGVSLQYLVFIHICIFCPSIYIYILFSSSSMYLESSVIG